MKINIHPVLVCVALLLAITSPSGRADTVALTMSGSTRTSIGNDCTVGWSFTLSVPQSVTQLGFYANPSSLNATHPVGIWTSTGMLLLSATVPAGTAGTYLDSFRYVTLSVPTILPAGSYVIGAYSPSNQDLIAVQATTVTTASGIAYTGSRNSINNTQLTFPADNNAFGYSNSYFGPNFQSNPVVVPEPSSLIGCFGLLGLTCICSTRSVQKHSVRV